MGIEVGAVAPDFTCKDQHGQDVTLSSFRVDKSVVVMFYPFAFSGICTGELGEVRDHLPEFVNDDVVLLAVSCDPMYALRAFSDQESLGYPLLSDFWPHGAIASAYGVFDSRRGCALRGTFLIDRDGRVAWKVENGLPEARDLEQYRTALVPV